MFFIYFVKKLDRKLETLFYIIVLCDIVFDFSCLSELCFILFAKMRTKIYFGKKHYDVLYFIRSTT